MYMNSPIQTNKTLLPTLRRYLGLRKKNLLCDNVLPLSGGDFFFQSFLCYLPISVIFLLFSMASCFSLPHVSIIH